VIGWLFHARQPTCRTYTVDSGMTAANRAFNDAYAADWGLVAVYPGKLTLAAEHDQLYDPPAGEARSGRATRTPLRPVQPWTVCGIWKFSRETFSHTYETMTALEAMELAIFRHARLDECLLVGAIAGEHALAISRENLPP
jgi:hypothetical protein